MKRSSTCARTSLAATHSVNKNSSSGNSLPGWRVLRQTKNKEPSSMSWIRALILLCVWVSVAAAQIVVSPRRREAQSTLQLGTPVERTISPGQIHQYTINAEENTFVQITVEQRGIDVVIRVHTPTRRPAEYDSPNGDDGPEHVSFVANSKGPVRVEVTPLSREPRADGRYEIKLVELRPSTEDEIKESKNYEALKARGIALLIELEGVISELRLPQTRIKAQLQVAQL